MSAQPNFNWHDTEGSGRPILSDYAEDRTAKALADLRELPSVLAEVSLTDHQSFKAAAALARGDHKEFACIWIDARDEYVTHLINDRRDRIGADWLAELEAIEQLTQVYA